MSCKQMTFLKSGVRLLLLQLPPQPALNEDQRHLEADPVENKYIERTSCKHQFKQLGPQAFLHDAAETTYYKYTIPLTISMYSSSFPVRASISYSTGGLFCNCTDTI
uniref:Uncharacterized protein n=1 Tax=Zea mays TaxID=4577 RepID=A0A804LD97_MAIZE